MLCRCSAGPQRHGPGRLARCVSHSTPRYPYKCTLSICICSHDFLKISHHFPKISHHFPKISHDLWSKISHEFPKISHDFPKISLHFSKISLHFPNISLQIPKISLHLQKINLEFTWHQCMMMGVDHKGQGGGSRSGAPLNSTEPYGP